MPSGPLPAFPFQHSLHDRLGERRRDEEFLAKAWADGDSRVLVMCDKSLLVEADRSRLRLLPTAEAPEGQRLLLGAVDGIVHFLVLADSAVEGELATLRELVRALDETEASLAAHAVALGGWHLRHPFCAVCGSATEAIDAGESRRCPVCSAAHFPRTDPAVIMLVTDDQDRCLLGNNAARPKQWFSTLAGFVEPGEAAEHAVMREVWEEAGIEVTDVTYAGSQPWPFPASLMIGFFARAVTTDIHVDAVEITEARWFSREDLRTQVEAGEIGLPPKYSIAGALVGSWYGEELPTNRLEW